MSKAEDLKKVRVNALLSLDDTQIIRFKGACLLAAPGTQGFVSLTSDRFAELCYEQFGTGVAKSAIGDIQHAVEITAPDWTDTGHLIGIGDGRVWDMRALAFVDTPRYVYSTNIVPNRKPESVALVKEYLLSLADGDEALAHDYIHMTAPLFMEEKPDGIIWLLGAGANGKSAFLDMLWLMFGKHFEEQTIEMIEDGRATPSLRGILGNIVRENSERRVEDSQKYKNMGAHETFPIRVLGTHSVVTVDLNFHTMLNANNVPSFADKTMGSRRRTLLVPFPAVFTPVSGFKARTFTPEFMGAFMQLCLDETAVIAAHGYSWSEQTTLAQQRYNNDANTAEAFARNLDELGVVAFKNYHILRMHYETWCASSGVVALGRTHLTQAIDNTLKPKQQVYRDEHGITVKRYFLPDFNQDNVVWLDNGYATAKEKLKVTLEQLNLAGEELHEW